MASPVHIEAGYIGLFYVAILLAGATTAGGRIRRLVGLLLAAAALAIPFFLQNQTLRVACALVALAGMLRTIELATDPCGAWATLPLRSRLWHVVGLIDTRLAKRAPAALDRSLALRITGFSFLLVVGVAAATHAAEIALSPLREIARWAGGLTVIYSGVEAVLATIELGYRLAGFRPATLHRDPILSRSVAEFWGSRWNRTVHRFLKRWAYLPVARARGSQAGSVAAFVVSALLHAYLGFVLVEPWLALMMGSFFLVQIPLLALEERLAVRRWPPAAAHAWTLSAMLLPSPLFIEPCLAAIGL